MQILHADTDDLGNPLRGGQPVRTYAINSRLANRHKIVVATSVYKGCRRQMVRDGVHYRRLGLRIGPLGLTPHLTFLSCLGPWVAASPHDLVVEEMTPPVGFCCLPWWTRKPVVSIVQWFFFETWEKQYRLPFQSWMRCIAARNRYRWFIVQSEAMGRIIRDLVPGAVVRKIPCGLEHDAFISWEKIGNYALFLGRLDIKQKGLDLLLKAWVRLGQDKGIPLVIAGEGPDRKALEQEVKKAGIEKMVTFAGRLEGTKKREVLSSCRFLVMPSREETFGLTALEAMGISKPVVAFNIPHLNEIVQNEWGVLVEPFDATAFGIAAHELWTNPDLCRDYGHRAYREALKYHWDILARRQEEFYLEVVEGQTE